MANNSLIQGTTWYWRKTFVNVPMHACNRFSGAVEVHELCWVADDPEKTHQLAKELSDAHIEVHQKEVHIASKNIPQGCTILYTRQPHENIEDDEDDFKDAQQNLQKLKDYIRQNGGKIDGEKPSATIGKSLFQFWRRRFTTKN